MTSNLTLLKILSDGDLHSGEELSVMAGVSRTAIWKQLQKLQEDTGLQLEALKGKGYRLPGGIELLDPDIIIDLLSPLSKALLKVLDIHDQVGSTNSLALNLAQNADGSGHVIVAEQQLAGRGRRGRSWISPYGCNIYCSVIWQFQGGAAALEGLSLAVGVAVARALKRSGIDGIAMKWPNDILWKGSKLSGILLEMVGDAAGRCQVVVGIGLNVAMTKGLATSAIDQAWTDATTAAGIKISRNELLANLLSELLPALAEFEARGFSAFKDAWSAMDMMVGKQVAVQLGESTVIGIAAGVGDNGAFALDTDLGRQWFHGGEVSLRLSD